MSPHPAIVAGLAADERIIWFSNADPRGAIRAKSGVGAFGAIWLTTSILLFAPALRKDRDVLIGALLVSCAVGMGLLLAPAIAWLVERETFAAITNRRFIVTNRKGSRTKSILLSGIRQVERIRRGKRWTLKIPAAVVDGDESPIVGYFSVDGVSDGDTAFMLLTGARSIA